MSTHSIMIRREGTPRNWSEAPGKQGEMVITLYALWCNSPMSYDNYTAPYDSV